MQGAISESIRSASPGTHVKYKPYTSKRDSVTSIHSLTGSSVASTSSLQEVAPAPSAQFLSRPPLPEQFLRSNSAPTVSSATSPPVQAVRKTGFAIHSPSPLAAGSASTSGASTPARQKPINPAQNSLDRFPSPPPTYKSNSFAAAQAFSISPGNTSTAAADYFHATHSSLSTLINGTLNNGKQRSLAVPSPSIPVQPGRAPYLPGFQPPGVYRIRTDEFAKSRANRGEVKKLESGRINRRLEKIINLHFPPPNASPTLPETLVRSSSNTSFSFKDLGTSRSVTPSELWTSVRRSVQGSSLRKAEDLRRQEQNIVKWQDDRQASKCPLCSVPFGLAVRKHHCRLCGRIVCYVPPNDAPEPLRRTERCSTFISYQWDEVDDGVLVELEDTTNDEQQALREKEGVRICKECLDIIMHNQSVTKPSKTPNWLKLHDILIGIQAEIDRALPAFQEQILQTSTPIESLSPTQRTSLLASRKKLLSLLASFDVMAKRIRDLPVDNKTPNSAQERLQKAIASRATIFLQERMGLLKGLGSFDDLPGANKNTTIQIDPSVVVKKRKAKLRREASNRSPEEQEEARREIEERAVKLTVLLEQERLVSDYLADANAKRQLVDAASLKASLEELKEEIQLEKEFLGLA